MAFVRSTGTSLSPTFSVAIQVASRVVRTFCAIRAIASSQEMSCHLSLRETISGDVRGS